MSKTLEAGSRWADAAPVEAGLAAVNAAHDLHTYRLTGIERAAGGLEK